jgi:hypothetical protein
MSSAVPRDPWKTTRRTAPRRDPLILSRLPARARRFGAQLDTHLTLLTIGWGTNWVPPVPPLPAPAAAGAIRSAPLAVAAQIRFACPEDWILDGTS